MQSPCTSRRSFLKNTGIAAAASLAGIQVHGQSAQKIEVTDLRTISLQPQYYIGWPTLTRRTNGDLVVVYSGGREGHVCPFGRVDMMVSHNNGETWQWPQTLIDGPIDDRDAGVVESAKGTLLVTTFTSLAYEPGLRKMEAQQSEPGAVESERLRSWRLVHGRISDAQRKAELGEWLIRSTDGGISWSARVPTIVNSPHGPTQLSDGRLLYAGKELWTEKQRIGVAGSLDDGATWKWLAEIPIREGDQVAKYHELHAVETKGGGIILHIRNENPNGFGETLQSESSDGGKTWSVPRSIGVWGLPSFLLKLRDGRLLMTYGHRRAPLGNQARISTDDGRTWSDPMIISGDGTSGDLGYPSTVELADGTFVTVWYELMKGSKNAVLRQARWRLS